MDGGRDALGCRAGGVGGLVKLAPPFRTMSVEPSRADGASGLKPVAARAASLVAACAAALSRAVQGHAKPFSTSVEGKVGVTDC